MKLSVHEILQLRRKSIPKRERYFGEAMDTGKNYRPKYLCFACRKVVRVSRKKYSDAMGCGSCGGAVYRIGPMFKPPKANTRRGKKAWEKIEKSLSYKTKFFAIKRYDVYKANRNESNTKT